ncbi:hypothetical protein CSAL01_12929 [Colletotrichum salicis]|uniref:Uncharacterized protein n=1 Tax=Colletotrichum salicis TaxID=1209931 RepID=A0A135V696_9PEZI|nr:hypothetical protein CSAL01_12929 [Colletotrichum salicis]
MAESVGQGLLAVVLVDGMPDIAVAQLPELRHLKHTFACHWVLGAMVEAVLEEGDIEVRQRSSLLIFRYEDHTSHIFHGLSALIVGVQVDLPQQASCVQLAAGSVVEEAEKTSLGEVLSTPVFMSSNAALHDEGNLAVGGELGEHQGYGLVSSKGVREHDLARDVDLAAIENVEAVDGVGGGGRSLDPPGQARELIVLTNTHDAERQPDRHLCRFSITDQTVLPCAGCRHLEVEL